MVVMLQGLYRGVLAITRKTKKRIVFAINNDIEER